MGGAVSAVRSAVRGFVVDVGKFIVKKGVSFVGGKIPIIGGAMADWVNGKIGGRFAKGGELQMGYNPNGDPSMIVKNKADLKKLIEKFPDLALKYGLTPEKVNNFQVKSVANETETQQKTALEEDQGEKKADEYAGNASINKSLALKRGGRVRARSESPKPMKSMRKPKAMAIPTAMPVSKAKAPKAKAPKAKPKSTKPNNNPWLAHLWDFRNTKGQGMGMSYKDAMKAAALTYNRADMLKKNKSLQ
jgi:hypothetical protein